MFLRSSDSLALVDMFFQRSPTCTKTAERAVRKRRIPVEESAPHRGDRVQRIRTLIRPRRSRYNIVFCTMVSRHNNFSFGVSSCSINEYKNSSSTSWEYQLLLGYHYRSSFHVAIAFTSSIWNGCPCHPYRACALYQPPALVSLSSQETYGLSLIHI